MADGKSGETDVSENLLGSWSNAGNAHQLAHASCSSLPAKTTHLKSPCGLIHSGFFSLDHVSPAWVLGRYSAKTGLLVNIYMPT